MRFLISLNCYHQRIYLRSIFDSSPLNQTKYFCTQHLLLSNKFSKSNYILNKKNLNDNCVFVRIESPLIIPNNFKSKFHSNSILFEMINDKNVKETVKQTKKQSKFRQFYAQYGPTFLIVHLTTVVMWIYLFYIISKQ
jgi:hypothetical protein